MSHGTIFSANSRFVPPDLTRGRRQFFARIIPAVVALILLVPPRMIAATPAAATVVVKKFRINDIKSKTLYYTGTETHEGAGKEIKRTTEYFRPGETSSIQKEVVIVDKDSLKAASYTFHNNESGEDFVLTTAGDQVNIEHLIEKGAKPKKYELSWDVHTIIGRSVHDLLMKHWDKLLAEQQVTFTMIIPYRGDSFKFVLKMLSKENHQVVFRLEPSSWIIRAIASSMDFHYRTDSENKNPVIVRYEGPMPILINGKKEQVAEMVFE